MTTITAHGFWLLAAQARDREYFVPFADYPVFLKATMAQIYAVRQNGPTKKCR